jgi:dolichol-phosphate mannosyltransferase
MIVPEVAEMSCMTDTGNQKILAARGTSDNGTIWERMSSLLGCRRIAGFFCIGIVSSAIDISLLYLFTTYLGMWYLISAACSYCCGTLVSYGLNRHFTFRDDNRNYFVQFSTFAVISVSCLIVNLALIWLFVEVFSFNYLTAKVIATVSAFFWNYHGQSRITFRGVNKNG